MTFDEIFLEYHISKNISSFLVKHILDNEASDIDIDKRFNLNIYE